MHQLNQHAEERKDLISHDPFNKKEVDNSPPRQKQTISSTNTTTEAAISSKSLFLVGVFTIIWYNTSSKNAIATQQLVEYYNNYIAEQSSTGSEGTGSIMVETGIFLSHHVLHFCMMTSLTTMQLIVGLGIATLLSSRHSALGFFSPSNNSDESSSSSSRIEDISPERKFYSRLIGTLHYLGSFFTNMGFAYGSASIVQVIKLLEPIETLLLSFIVHQLIVKYKKGKSTENATGPNIGIVKVISVFIIVTGTSLLLTSKGIKKNVNAYTVIFALLSGFALSSRNVAQKTATRKEKNVIATMIVESSSMTNKNHKTAGSELREAAALGLQNFISITSYAIIPALIFLLFVELHGVEGIDGSVVIWILTSTGDFGLQAILFHGLYNIASISVLGLVSAPTHSLLNVGKRISNVLVAAVFFSEPLGTHGAFGLSMAAVGGCIYSKSNSVQNHLQVTTSKRKMAYAGMAILMPLVFLQLLSNPLSLESGQTSSYESKFLSQRPSHFLMDRVRKNRVVLLGPHERYNFGDLLFSKILDKLLRTRVGYDPQDILKAATTPADMTKYGGFNDIVSMKTIQQMSRTDSVYGPYDIVYTGGEALGCTYGCAIGMLPTQEQRELARQERICDCGYLVPKSYLLPEGATSKNYAVVNSMGGDIHPSCQDAVNSADFIAYRDRAPTYPDSAVMTKELFHDDIANAAKEVLKELFPDDPMIRGGSSMSHTKYIAVQHNNNEMEMDHPREFAAILDKVSKNTGAVIVFFAAGTAPYHDSFDVYHEISSYMTEPNIVYEMENVWKVVGLISQAEAVLATSLHVRIMSFIYFKPRITWCSLSKHRQFISLWDTADSPQCIHTSVTWNVLVKYLGSDPEITQDMTKHIYEEMVQKYLQGFDIWSTMLAQGDDPVHGKNA